jgi:hypothetical protein
LAVLRDEDLSSTDYSPHLILALKPQNGNKRERRRAICAK